MFVESTRDAEFVKNDVQAFAMNVVDRSKGSLAGAHLRHAGNIAGPPGAGEGVPVDTFNVLGSCDGFAATRD